MPKVGSSKKYTLDHTVYWEIQIRTALTEQTDKPRVAGIFGTIRDEIDLTILSTLLQHWTESLTTVVAEVVECVVHPLALVDLDLLPTLFPQDQAVLYLLNDKSLLIMINDSFDLANTTAPAVPTWYQYVLSYMDMIDVSVDRI